MDVGLGGAGNRSHRHARLARLSTLVEQDAGHFFRLQHPEIGGVDIASPESRNTTIFGALRGVRESILHALERQQRQRL